MKQDIFIQKDIVIPAHELTITTSRADGPGGQHVNKSNTRITLRWNLQITNALTEEEKNRALRNLKGQLTSDGELVIHSGSSRSQHHNRKIALEQLAKRIRTALYVPKKRVKTKVSEAAREKRIQEKKRRASLKKLRVSKDFE